MEWAVKVELFSTPFYHVFLFLKNYFFSYQNKISNIIQMPINANCNIDAQKVLILSK